MINFGYFISKDTQIDFDKNNRQIAAFVIKNEPSFKLCIACGSCSATCSAANFTDFNIRKLNVLVKRGETENLKSEMKKCMLCGKCLLVCPRGVNTRNMVIAIKQAINLFDKA